MELSTAEEARRRCKDPIDGRESWVVPWSNDRAADLGGAIERRHHGGTAGADFLLPAVPPSSGARSVSFARKRRTTAAQPADTYADVEALGGRSRDETERQVADHDVPIAADGPPEGDPETVLRPLAWHGWVIES